MKRKYWLGISDSNEHKPTEYDIYIVGDRDDLAEALESITETVEHDFNCYEELEGED